MVSSPVIIQVKRSPPGEPVTRLMSAATINIPEPIIEPTTIMVPSNNPIARTNPGSSFVERFTAGSAASAISDSPQFLAGCAAAGRISRYWLTRAAGFFADKISRITAMLSAPASMTSCARSNVMPPIAMIGLAVRLRA